MLPLVLVVSIFLVLSLFLESLTKVGSGTPRGQLQSPSSSDPACSLGESIVVTFGFFSASYLLYVSPAGFETIELFHVLLASIGWVPYSSYPSSQLYWQSRLEALQPLG